jgi:ribosomal protein L17
VVVFVIMVIWWFRRIRSLAGLTRNAAAKALEVLGPKYVDRKGGYTRLIKLNNPAAGKSKAVLEFVE